MYRQIISFLSHLFETLVVCVVVFFMQACATSDKLKNENLTSTFSNKSGIFNPEFTAFQFTDDSLKIVFKIPLKNLLYMKAGENFVAGLKLQYFFFASYKSSQPVDSGSVYYQVESPNGLEVFRNEFVLKYTANTPLILKLVLRDLNRNTETFSFLNLEKASSFSPQRFLLTDSMSLPVFNGFVEAKNNYSLDPGSLSFDMLWVRCYFKDYPLAVLPFRVIDDPVFNMESDSVFRISRKDLQSIRFNRNGIYYFQADTLSAEGFALKCFDAGFPKVNRAEQLIESTRYITTRREYLQLMNSSDKKEAIDKFWLDIGGHPDRARNLIRAYYNRLQESNRLFTSYQEGWKTDRGMIYIIYGEPISVYRDDETEQWSYSNLPGLPDILFLFRKMNNPFSENDYALIRQPAYENLWFIAVDQWRQGRIVNDD